MNLQRLESAVVCAETDADHFEHAIFANGEAVWFTTRAPGKLTNNEDALALVPLGPEQGVLVVADGAGGMPAGEQASRIAVQSLVDALAQRNSGNGLREAILDGIEQANTQIAALGSGAATTIAVVELQGNTLRSYHVGDSLIFLTGQRGRIKMQTVAHSPVGYAVESGMMDEAEAVHHEDRNIVSNLLGCSDMRIEIGPTLTLAPRDTLIVASDAVPDNLYTDEIAQHVRAGPLFKATSTLVETCHERMSGSKPGVPAHPDDLSVIAFRLRVPQRKLAV